MAQLQSTSITGSLNISAGATGSFSGSFSGNGSQLTGIPYSNISSIPSGIVSGSAQIAALGYATTSSNTFQANQVITGSLFISQNLIVGGSSSIQYISSSVVDIADNIITVNAFNPGVRFGGLAVADSGSSPRVSGSILFDSVRDQWIFVHENQSVITSSVVLMGPETYNNLGNETYLSANRLPKGSGIEHLRDSNITDTGTQVSINSNTIVTGSFTVVTGSNVEFQVTNAGVNLGNVFTDVHTVTGSFNASGSVNLTPSVVVTGDGSNDIIRAVRAGTTRFVVKNGVNTVGINTDTINNPLTVNGGADFNGSVGIGYTSPSYRLSVSGSSNSGIFLKQGSQIGDSPSGSNFYSALTFENTSTTNAWSMGYSQGAKFSINYFDASSTYSRYFTIAPGGNVGIGTINPAGELHIVNASGTGQPVLELEQLNAGSNILQWKGSAGSYLGVIQNGGNVGIGTTNPSTLLHVSGSSSSIGRIVSTFALSSGYSDVVQILNPNQTGGGLSFNIGKAESTRNLGKIVYVHSSDGSTSNRLSFGFFDADNLMNLTAGGNVGIGTTSPSDTLHVAKNGTTSYAAALWTNSSSTANLYVGVGGSGVANTPLRNNAYVMNASASDLILGTSDAERLRITSAGYLVLGATSSVYGQAGRGTFEMNGSSDNILAMRVGGSLAGYLYSNASFMEVYSTNYLSFAAGGAERMRITSAGAVAIGATSTNGRLGVRGTTGDSTAYAFEAANSSGNSLFLVRNDGNVGIGPNAPGLDLDVRKTKAGSTVGLRVRNDSTSANSHAYINLAVNETNSDPYIAFDYAQSAIWIAGVDGSDSDKFKISNNSSTYLPGAGDILTITTGGNVGIGTTSPDTRLTVYAGSGTISGTNDAIRLQVASYNNAARNTIVWAQDSAGIILGRFGLEWNTGTAQMNFVWRDMYNSTAGSTELMRLTGGGNLGIGTTSPSNRLHVASSDNEGIYMQGTSNGGHWFNFKSANSNLWSMGAQPGLMGWYNRTDSTYKMVISDGGNLGINTTSPSSRLSVCSTTACSTVVDVQGCAGQLFSVTDNLVGEIFAVSDVSGIPILSVDSNGTVFADSKIAVGANHTVSGDYASITGGRCNVASGACSTVSGGYRNTACGINATISGGGCNTASGYRSILGGGAGNSAVGSFSTLSGGRFNSSCGCYSSVVGGIGNSASGYAATSLGGNSNNASYNFSSVANCNQSAASACEFRVQNLSKQSGTFRIDHPDPTKINTHYLSHSFVESPTAGDNIYRYKVTIVNGQATITLPSYYKYLNENDQIWVTPQGHFGIGYGEINNEQTQLTIYGNTDGEYNILLIGTRKDSAAVHHWQGVETYK